ncbi:MAG: hypothetical protein KDI01_12105, partial [Halioglobus sp.]|nr:hypothetical protein [Halioglobus sp.]
MKATLHAGWSNKLRAGPQVVLTVSLALLPHWAFAWGDETPDAARIVRREALLPNQGPEGRPLPLVAHWHRRSLPLKFQIELIRQGHYILPWMAFDGPFTGRRRQEISEPDELAQLREWGLPLTLITGGQWEAAFYSQQDYKKAPASETGVAISASSGEKIKAVSPLSPLGPWKELGRRWTDNAVVRALAEIYPDVPRVFFVSNNEANEIRWHALDKDKYFVDLYGTDRDDEFKRRVLQDGYILRYKALIDGMREGLPNAAWKQNSRFIAYNALGPDHFGRPMGLFSTWYKHATTTRDRIAWEPFAWEGAVPESYDNQWEPEKLNWRVWSCQVEMMNGVLLRQEAFRANPEFWHEVIFWNGDIVDQGKNGQKSKVAQYAARGVTYTPELYAGGVKHNLWVLTPRVAREWRGSADDKERWWPYFQVIIDAVDQIHHDPVLVRFWRRGELVANHARRHPFDDDIPEKWKNVDRWFNLDTSLDPPGAWDLTTELPVMAVARVLGDAGHREWLLYVQAT